MQAGSPGSSQTLTGDSGTAGASEDIVAEFLTALRSALVAEPLTDAGESADVEEMIALVEAERTRLEPNRKLAATFTSGLRDIALGMAASGGWAGAVALAHRACPPVATLTDQRLPRHSVDSVRNVSLWSSSKFVVLEWKYTDTPESRKTRSPSFLKVVRSV